MISDRGRSTAASYKHASSHDDEVSAVDPPHLAPSLDPGEALPLLQEIERVAFEDDHAVASRAVLAGLAKLA